MDPRRVHYWEDLSLHRDFLADRVRNEAYQEAIRRHVSPRTRVLDIGTGTGVVAMFSAQAGAAHVTAVDWSGLLPYAAEAARRSGLAERMTFLRADLTEWQSDERFELVTHDLIGGFLWEENAVAILGRIGERCLAPGGRILPACIDLYLAPVCLPELVDTSFWHEPRYGLDLSSFAAVEEAAARSRLRPTVVHWRGDDRLLAGPRRVATLDAHAPKARPHVLELELELARPGTIEGVLGCFVVHLDEHTRFSTAPTAPPTHWGQLFVPVERPLDARPGDLVHIVVEPADRCADWRASATAPARDGK